MSIPKTFGNIFYCTTLSAIVSLGLCGLFSMASFASSQYTIDQRSGRYITCLEQIEQDPTAAYDQANAWRRSEVNASAQHCEALALVELGSYKAGAKILTGLASAEDTGDINTRATLHDQAGNAWMLAHDPGKAITSFNAALALGPSKPWIKTDIYVDRGAAYAMSEDWPSAERDYSLALAILPQQLDAVLARAGARRVQGDPVGALADIEFALGVDPESIEALVERGLLRVAYNDPKGAKKDFEEVVARAPDSPAAAIARNGLAKLSIRGAD